jgi:hypothetical protein
MGNQNRKYIVETSTSHGIELKPQDETYLFAIGPADDGYFMVEGNLDYDTYNAIVKEAEKNSLKPPYHVYGNFET